MNKLQGILLILGILFGSMWIAGDTTDPSLLTLERIFSSEEFTAQRLPPVRWWQKGNSYTIVKKSTEMDNGEDLVPAGRLVPPGKKNP